MNPTRRTVLLVAGTGTAAADYYALTHRSYVDELVFWGGSSGEGLMRTPPCAPSGSGSAESEAVVS
ncbi:hypothetical protein ACPYPG_24650 [Streptomyces sp. FR-108]|uniref:hypothetical protein n=1 Tax=Streptomyces sp. FR-108 TaxID=3416665 RepID=UPI003CED9AB2